MYRADFEDNYKACTKISLKIVIRVYRANFGDNFGDNYRDNYKAIVAIFLISIIKSNLYILQLFFKH